MNRPVIGGTFANPVPTILSEKWTLFIEYPYLLPSFVTGFFSLIVVILAAKHVPEVSTAFRGYRTCLIRQTRTIVGKAGETSLRDEEETGIPLLQRDGSHMLDKETDQSASAAKRVAPTKRIKHLLQHGPFRMILLLFVSKSDAFHRYITTALGRGALLISSH